jgi:hypothetical protein
VAYSQDGITWTVASESMRPIDVNRIAYGNGRFVAVDLGSRKAACSTDGVAWTAATLPSEASWQGIAYGNGVFVAVARSSNKAAYSQDGITWTTSTLPSSDFWTSVAYGGAAEYDISYVGISLSGPSKGIAGETVSLTGQKATFGGSTVGDVISFQGGAGGYPVRLWYAGTLSSQAIGVYQFIMPYSNVTFMPV